MAITQSILDISKKVGEEHGAKRIKEVRIKVGEYSGVVPQCVRYYFDVISKGTICEGAVLNIMKLPVKIYCNNCNEEFEISRYHVKCPKCAGTDIKMTQGREFYIESLEVE